jgi:hypothetical protein
MVPIEAFQTIAAEIPCLNEIIFQKDWTSLFEPGIFSRVTVGTWIVLSKIERFSIFQ